MKKIVVLVAALGAGLLPVTAADAALPAFNKHLIEPNKSLAGVRLNESYAAVRQAFGGCLMRLLDHGQVHGCTFNAANGSGFGVFFASNTTSSSGPFFVGEIEIVAGHKLVHGSPVPVFTPPLTALKTASGIGLGSTPREVKKAYPNVTGSSAHGYLLRGGGLVTTFGFANGRVVNIVIAAGKYAIFAPGGL
jgi:hypothetical protein